MQPCPACNRHIRDAICPFCGAVTAVQRESTPTLGKMSRAMVFASATLVATACGHAQHKSPDEMGEQRHAGGGGCSDPDPATIANLEAQKAEIDKEPEGPDKDAHERTITEELASARQPSCMPYGAPPARRRVV